MIIAHRGVHNNVDIPENSILSYKIALDKNYGIEFDVHISKDDKLVVFHDDNLKRMTSIISSAMRTATISVSSPKSIRPKRIT